MLPVSRPAECFLASNSKRKKKKEKENLIGLRVLGWCLNSSAMQIKRECERKVNGTVKANKIHPAPSVFTISLAWNCRCPGQEHISNKRLALFGPWFFFLIRWSVPFVYPKYFLSLLTSATIPVNFPPFDHVRARALAVISFDFEQTSI